MKLTDVIMIAADTTRTKAYLQVMISQKIIPNKVLIMSGKECKMQQELADYKLNESKVSFQYFNQEEPLLYTIENSHISYEFVEEDINSEEILKRLENLDEQYIIYSGYGGAILRKPLFEIGKKYIHVHAGKLPMYRGSTTAYYSIIDNGNISASAIFLSPQLDAGELIATSDFVIPDSKVNIDYIYEPYVRAKVLTMALSSYIEEGKFSSIQQDTKEAQTYYIIHPVLKHLALLKIEQDQRMRGEQK